LWDSVETAHFLNVPERTLDQWAYQGVGPAFSKIGKHRRYHPDDVEAYRVAQRRDPRTAA
jgi:hypothetical protein